MTSSSYFRYPHLHGDLITFVAEDDVWVAPLDGGRAWRVSSLQLPARNPRFTPDGTRLVWTVVQGNAPEVVSAAVDGGDFRQLTYFGHPSTKVKGFAANGDVVVTSAFEQAESRHTWAYAVKLDGSGRTVMPYGPVDSVAFGPEVGDERPVVVSSVLSREPAWWKRYRGGAAGKLWIDADGSGEFSRLVPELAGNLADPLWVGDRIAFLSDHEGHGNLYSVLPKGGKLRRHTDHEGFYVRHASTDGKRVVFESAGNLFLLKDLEAEPIELAITLGSASTGRRPKPLNVAKHLGEVFPDSTGRASAVEAHGTAHWLTHRDGPSRILEATPGVRARLVRPLGIDKVVYVADHDGLEALYIRNIRAAAASGPAAALPRPASEERWSDADSAVLPQPVSAIAVNQGGISTGSENGRGFSGQGSSGHGGVGHESSHTGQASPNGDAGADGQGHPEQNGSNHDNGTAPGSGVETGAQRIALEKAVRVSQLVCSPDGSLVAVATEFGRVLVLDVATGSLREVASTDVGAIDQLTFAPDS
ncbi:MAG TPA: peptidase S41, partial [Micrococcaceae bacterium]